MTRCMVGGDTRLPCPTLLRSRMNPLPSASPPPPSQLFGCSVACLTPSASQSAPLRFIATAPSPPLDCWLSCCPFACLRLSASASASCCTPPFAGCGCLALLDSSICWLSRRAFTIVIVVSHRAIAIDVVDVVAHSAVGIDGVIVAIIDVIVSCQAVAIDVIIVTCHCVTSR